MADPARLPVQQGYDRWSEVYDTDGNPLFVLEEPIVRGWLGEVAGLRIADVGCGTGRHTAWMVRAGARVVALDCSGGMMARARERAGGRHVLFCRHALPESLPLGDGSCHHLVFALVAEHVERLNDICADFARVLMPGGSLIFTALHPAMNLKGITARFFDPGTGGEVRVEAFEHTVADYVMAIVNAGLDLVDIAERKADQRTARLAPRAAKYLGWPMLLAIKAIKPG